jgi:apolipoprotein N-acyltransferase
VFPEISRAFVSAGANVLVNITNDAWYGVSSAPYQHLNMYRMRAVELGRSYVRATNTGISAWVDKLGVVHGATPLFKEAILVADVPLNQEKTLYALLGNWVVYLVLAYIFWTLVRALRYKIKAKTGIV